jgi:hypothetical protein
MEEEKKELTPEQQIAEAQKKAILLMEQKIIRVTKQINELLEKEGLELSVNHTIDIIPRRQRQ